jgi:hypothetical protein
LKTLDLYQINPKLKQLEDRKVALDARKAALIEECTHLRQAIRDGQNGSDSERRVKQIIAGEIPTNATPLTEELNSVLVELNDVNSALGTLDALVQNERRVASRAACDLVRPEVDKSAKAFAAAYVNLYNTHVEYENTLESVERQGVNISSLNRIWLSSLGSVHDPSGSYHYCFEDFISSGALSKRDVPEAVR